MKDFFSSLYDKIIIYIYIEIILNVVPSLSPKSILIWVTKHKFQLLYFNESLYKKKLALKLVSFPYKKTSQ